MSELNLNGYDISDSMKARVKACTSPEQVLALRRL